MDMNSIKAGMWGDKEHHSYYMICLDSLSHQLRILNSAVPELLGEWSPIKKFKEESADNDNTKITINDGTTTTSYNLGNYNDDIPFS